MKIPKVFRKNRRKYIFERQINDNVFLYVCKQGKYKECFSKFDLGLIREIIAPPKNDLNVEKSKIIKSGGQKMNVQESLENYNSMKAKISMLKLDIEKINNEIIDSKSAQLTGMPKAKGFIGSPLEKQVIKRQEVIANKEKDRKELECIIDIIERLIKTLKKSEQDIIEAKYFKGMSIAQIATEKDRTYVTIYRSLKTAIKKMQQEFDKNIKMI